MTRESESPFEVQVTPLRGVTLLFPKVHRDSRGLFVKTFHGPAFAAAGMKFDPQEGFYTVSSRGVIRGMHFQVPPAATAKVVACLSGKVRDVVLDLRRGEPTYGVSWSVELDGNRSAALHLPVGVAHGFAALEDNSLLHYLCSAPHSSQHDRGIRWDSFGFSWGQAAPVVSERDRALPPLGEFVSPF